MNKTIAGWMVAASVLGAGCKGGCGGKETAQTQRGPVPGALAMFPAETRIVVSVDIARIRATALWKALSSLGGERVEDRRLLADLVARTGVDPWKQVHRVTLGFPEEARARGEIIVVIDGEGFEEKRIVPYLQDQARLKRRELRLVSQQGRRLWAFEGEVTVTGFMVDSRRIVLGMGGWAQRAATVLDGPPEAAPPEPVKELMRLLDRVGVDRSLILGAIIPEGTRKRLLVQPNFSAQASVVRMGGAADLGPGLKADLVAELSNAADAQVLVNQFQTFLREIRGRPQILLLGAGPFLDAVSARPEGPNARFELTLDEARTGDVIGRLMGVLRLGLAVSGAKSGTGR